MKITKLFLPLLFCYSALSCTEEPTSNLTNNFFIASIEESDIQNILSAIASQDRKKNGTFQKNFPKITTMHFDSFKEISKEKEENEYSLREETKKEICKRLFQKNYNDTVNKRFHDKIVADFLIKDGLIIMKTNFSLSLVHYFSSSHVKDSPVTEQKEKTLASAINQVDGSLGSGFLEARGKYSACKYASRNISLRDTTNDYDTEIYQVRGQCTTKMPIAEFKKLTKRYHQKKKDNKKQS